MNAFIALGVSMSDPGDGEQYFYDNDTVAFRFNPLYSDTLTFL